MEPKTVATVAFISAVGIAGLIVGVLPTVADGRVVAGELFDTFKATNKRLAKIECDRVIPIGIDGAEFRCTHTAVDGSTVRYRYTMDRAGSMRGEPIVPRRREP